MNKKGINKNKIVSLIIVLVFLSMFVSVAVEVVPDIASNVYGLQGNLTTAEMDTALGTGATGILDDSASYFGWGLAASMVIMVIGLGFSIFRR